MINDNPKSCALFIVSFLIFSGLFGVSPPLTVTVCTHAILHGKGDNGLSDFTISGATKQGETWKTVEFGLETTEYAVS